MEKNPNAIVTLRGKVRSLWGSDKVTVVSSDMRVWTAPEQADILVSELLGSFGDNELSPECLDGAQSFLKPGGISIPSDSVSQVAPIMSAKLWSLVHAACDQKKAMETTYVVKMFNYYTIAEPQVCFYFKHPNYKSFPPNVYDTIENPHEGKKIVSTTPFFQLKQQVEQLAKQPQSQPHLSNDSKTHSNNHSSSSSSSSSSSTSYNLNHLQNTTPLSDASPSSLAAGDQAQLQLHPTRASESLSTHNRGVQDMEVEGADVQSNHNNVPNKSRNDSSKPSIASQLSPPALSTKIENRRHKKLKFYVETAATVCN